MYDLVMISNKWCNLEGGMYQDGHEREAFVLYRPQFPDCMSIYNQRKSKYDGDDLLTIVELELIFC